MRRHCRAVRFRIFRPGADVPQVKVTVNDKQCEPMTLTVNSGKTQFIIQNHSQKALEWEILKGVLVVEERENIARLQPEDDCQPAAGRV